MTLDLAATTAAECSNLGMLVSFVRRNSSHHKAAKNFTNSILAPQIGTRAISYITGIREVV